MSEPTRAANGPVAVDVESGHRYYWCSCGGSKNQPFCDGSHQGTEFTPLVYEAEKTGKVFFCACKATQKQPLCDGSHSKG